ncbi:hypothetical protein, conserved [Babesia ovata]|uniref:Uncharacterized protein n=1 Tax=Babesia ovata TaxID=189622 RepID=A0A2H6KDT4_9APIC|nr:uncharacterized protein BOVATA_026510 [Babesia ovata]GBE61158.1 hypothetical protein, conserved [Babesia ovata]
MASIRHYGRRGFAAFIGIYLVICSGLVSGAHPEGGNSGSGSVPDGGNGDMRSMLSDSSTLAVLGTFLKYATHLDLILHGPVFNEGNIIQAAKDLYPSMRMFPAKIEAFYHVLPEVFDAINRAMEIHKRYNDIRVSLGKIDPKSREAVELVDEQHRLESEFEEYAPLVEAGHTWRVDAVAPVVLRLFQDLERTLNSPSASQNPAVRANGEAPIENPVANTPSPGTTTPQEPTTTSETTKPSGTTPLTEPTKIYSAPKSIASMNITDRTEPRPEPTKPQVTAAGKGTDELGIPQGKSEIVNNVRDTKDAKNSSGHMTSGVRIIQTMAALGIIAVL